MKIAIIGSGISGLLSARLLAAEHDPRLRGQCLRVGGHANTVSFEVFGCRYTVDTGFMVFNDRTDPDFIRMLGRLGVAGTGAK